MRFTPGTPVWTTYNPVIGSLTGAFTAVAAVGRYMQVGKLVHFRVKVTITTNGTAGGAITCTLPQPTANIAANFTQVAIGREVALTGNGVNAELPNNSGTMNISGFNGAYLGADGYVIDVSGTYECA